jgi:hypothetical protein
MHNTAMLQRQGFQPYRKNETVFARQMNRRFTVQVKEGDILRGQPGDYVCYSPRDGSRWIVEQAIFENTYTNQPLAEDATHSQIVRKGFLPYRKHAVTWAKKLSRPVTVNTLEGKVQAHAGDYLCVGAAGETWPQPGERFEAVYERVESV